MSPSPDSNGRSPSPGDESSWLEIVEAQVKALNFGSVHITVHDGRVTQVETSVRLRFDKLTATP